MLYLIFFEHINYESNQLFSLMQIYIQIEKKCYRVTYTSAWEIVQNYKKYFLFGGCSVAICN